VKRRGAQRVEPDEQVADHPARVDAADEAAALLVGQRARGEPAQAEGQPADEHHAHRRRRRSGQADVEPVEDAAEELLALGDLTERMS